MERDKLRKEQKSKEKINKCDMEKLVTEILDTNFSKGNSYPMQRMKSNESPLAKLSDKKKTASFA